MWVWDRSIGLWLWGVFQPNQEIKCLFAQLDRPTTNQSNVVCDAADCHYGSGGGTHRALSLVFVFTGLKSAECLQMWVEPAARRQSSSPEPGTSPVCPPCGGPELRGPELRGGLRWVRGCVEVTGYQLPLASASCASPPHAPHTGPGMSRCFHAPLSHESTHLSSPAAGMFGDMVDYVTVDHLSIIV